MNGNIVAVVLPDLNPINQLGDHQMLGFVACIVKAAGPAQNLVHLDFIGLLVVLLHFQQDFGFFLLLCGGRNVQQPVLFLSRHKLIFERRSPMLQNNVEMDLKMCLIESGQHRGGGLQKSPVYLFPV